VGRKIDGFDGGYPLASNFAKAWPAWWALLSKDGEDGVLFKGGGGYFLDLLFFLHFWSDRLWPDDYDPFIESLKAVETLMVGVVFSPDEGEDPDEPKKRPRLG
jgi:hypothetical protein